MPIPIIGTIIKTVVSKGARAIFKRGARTSLRNGAQLTARTGSLVNTGRLTTIVNSGRNAATRGSFSRLKWVGGVVGAGLLQHAASVTLTSVFTGVITVTQTVMNFDFAATDESLKRQVQAAQDVLYGHLGGALGKSLGWTICGAIPGAIAMGVNPGVGAALFGRKNPQTGKWENGEFTDEMREEVLSSLAIMAWGAWRATAFAVVSESFRNARQWIKNDKSPFAAAIRDVIKGQIGEEKFEKWGKENIGTWSIAHQIEERIEAIPDEKMRRLVEEFWEELGDGCTEAMLTFSTTIDSYNAQRKMSQDFANNTVEVVFKSSS